MRIVLDTSVLVADHRLAGTQFRVFFESLKRTPYKLVLPEVVFHETVNKFQETVKKDLGSADKVLENLSRLTGRSLGRELFGMEWTVLVSEYSAWLRKRLDDAGAEWLAYPKAGHDAVAKRALDRRRPFDARGHNGYRDTLIWESVLDFARANPATQIALVTMNPRDFADTDRKTLHPHLVEDLRANKIPIGNVSLFVGLEVFLRAKVEPHLKKDDDIAIKLGTGTYPGFNLLGWLEDKLPEIVAKQADAIRLGISQDFEDPEIDTAHDITIVGTPEVRQLAGSEYLVDVLVHCELEVNVYMTKSDYYCRPDDEDDTFRLVDGDWNEHMVMGISMVPVELRVQFTFDDTKKVVTSTELVEGTRRGSIA